MVSADAKTICSPGTVPHRFGDDIIFEPRCSTEHVINSSYGMSIWGSILSLETTWLTRRAVSVQFSRIMLEILKIREKCDFILTGTKVGMQNLSFARCGIFSRGGNRPHYTHPTNSKRPVHRLGRRVRPPPRLIALYKKPYTIAEDHSCLASGRGGIPWTSY